jgi:hypothetical protein
MVALNSTAFVAVTGNGVTVSEDLARRFIHSVLDAKCEDPETRAFPSGFLEHIEARRPELLSACLKIWRYGRQNSNALTRGRPLGSFEIWSEWVRDPLLTLGCTDPVERIEVLKATDPRRQSLAELYEVWWDNHGDNPVKAADLADRVRNLIDPQCRGRQYVVTYVAQLSGTRAAGFVLHRQLPVGKWGASTYSLQRTGLGPDDGLRHRGHRDHGGLADRGTEPMPPMVPMPDAAEGGETPADHRNGAAADDSRPQESERQRPRAASCDNQEPAPVRSRHFVYQTRSLQDLLDRIQRWEAEHPRRTRRYASDPEADFIDADEENY